MNYKAKQRNIYLRLYLLSAMAIGSFILGSLFLKIERIGDRALFNTGVDICGLFICVALFYGCIDEKKIDKEGSAYWLMGLIFQIGLSFMNNIFCWYVSGVPEYRKLNLFLNQLTKIYDFSLVMLFYNYVRRMLGFKGKLAAWLNKNIFILIVPFIIMTMANTFVPINFLVDEDGFFQMLPLYHLVDIYMIIIAPLTILLIIRCDASFKQKYVALSFVGTPILHYAITGAAHGYATQYGSTLFAVTNMYGILFSDRNRILASTQAELDTARKIQAAMLPSIFPPFPDRTEFDIFAMMDPAKEVGGDFYDFFMIDNDHLGIVMADVSGKGVPGALFMMASRIILQSSAKMGLSPAEVLSRTNHAICSNNKEGMFVTVWFGVLEISTGLIRASNAGHEYPIIMKNGQQYELLKDRHGLVVGAMNDSKYTEYEISLDAGDKLFLYTDGIPEAVNRDHRQFGIENLLNTLNKAGDQDPEQTLFRVREAVADFVKEADQFDDVTMLCLRYNGTIKH